jgi:hypothetical protein
VIVQSLAIWIWGVVAGLVALVGLFMAGGAQDGEFAFAGLLFMLFGVAYIFYLITRYGPGGSRH